MKGWAVPVEGAGVGALTEGAGAAEGEAGWLTGPTSFGAKENMGEPWLLPAEGVEESTAANLEGGKPKQDTSLSTSVELPNI